MLTHGSINTNKISVQSSYKLLFILIINLTVMFPHTWTFGSLKPRLNLPKVYVVFVVF